jgi:hypothetical protein
MLLVCHAPIIRGQRLRDLAFRLPGYSLRAQGGLIPLARIQYRSNQWNLRLGEQPLARGLRPSHLRVIKVLGINRVVYS